MIQFDFNKSYIPNFNERLSSKYCSSMVETEKINGLARAEGLSYGQFVAKYKLYSDRPVEKRG